MIKQKPFRANSSYHKPHKSKNSVQEHMLSETSQPTKTNTACSYSFVETKTLIAWKSGTLVSRD
jgi:hypothetical protein